LIKVIKFNEEINVELKIMAFLLNYLQLKYLI